MWNRNYEKDIFLSVKDFINTNINSRHLESKLEIINRDSNVYKHVYKGRQIYFLDFWKWIMVFLFLFFGITVTRWYSSPKNEQTPTQGPPNTEQ